jgi:hypothetical protein
MAQVGEGSIGRFTKVSLFSWNILVISMGFRDFLVTLTVGCLLSE